MHCVADGSIVQSYSHIAQYFTLLCNNYVGAHCATDVTGFGILGHARNLAKAQKRAVSFKLHSLPSMLIYEMHP